MERLLRVFVVVAFVVSVACSSDTPRAARAAVASSTTTSAAATTTTAPSGSAITTTTMKSGNGVPVVCPVPRPPRGVRGFPGLTDLKMVSAQKGFAVGKGAVLVTDDGRTWSSRSPGSAALISVDALDADHAWAVGQHELLATSNGGRDWSAVGEPDGAELRAVHFTDAQMGWGIGSGQQVFRTGDGGRTWATVDPPCGAEAVCFTAADDGWAAAGPHIFRSTNGGDTWLPAFTMSARGNDNRFSPEFVHVDQLQCARPGVVWAYFTGEEAGTSNTPYIAYRGTVDGQWTPVMKEPVTGPPNIDVPAGGSHPAPMSAVGPDSAVYVTSTPLATPPVGLRIAINGGRSLSAPQPIPGLFGATSASFLSPETGWVLGAKVGSPTVDAILATTDGGRTWHEQATRLVPSPDG